MNVQRRLLQSVLAFALALAGSQQAFSQEWTWAQGFGGAGSDSFGGLVVDATDHFYLSGSFSQRITLGTNVVRSQGQDDFFLMKSDPSGQVNWVLGIGGELNDQSRGLGLDPQGNVCIAGVFGSSINVGGQWITSQGGQDLLIAKYDSAGGFLWSRHAGGLDADEARAFTVDLQGNCLLASVSKSQIIRFGDLSITNLGAGDIVLAKYGRNGDLTWVRQAGGAGDDFASALAVDPAGNIYVTGGFASPAQFGTHAITDEVGSTFLVKYNPEGEVIWVKTFGGAMGTFSTGLAWSPDNHLYLAGYYLDTATLGDHSLHAQGISDVFLARIDPDGTFLWAQSAGGVSLDRAAGVAADTNGTAFLTGFIMGEAQFGAHNVSSLGQALFAAQYSKEGETLRVEIPQAGFANEGKQIIPLTIQPHWIAGEFTGNIQLGDASLLSAGGRDIFLARLGDSGCAGPVEIRPIELKKIDSAAFEITAHVEPGQQFEIQATTNFTNWMVLTNFAASSNTLVFTDTIPPTSARLRFYRNVKICP
ncbi:MAG TPA: SBBP repeat-containing protein [Candidatus Paceibacterota bacterium]|nr:SBBP repeat-containing protein [Verrucomicrobiota bacterium]HRY49063.1 SBBP repeat-containing protein [Candidatus Paceibacterota bacterium]HRZ99153.1 SBBP repeat-containing protein [Candidatus Paceibacterota bacterium]